MAHALTTSTCVHHASKVVVEANTIVHDSGQETKWVTFSVKNAEGIEEMEFTVFDLDLADVVLMPNTQGVEALVNSAGGGTCHGTFQVEYTEGGGYETEGE